MFDGSRNIAAETTLMSGFDLLQTLELIAESTHRRRWARNKLALSWELQFAEQRSEAGVGAEGVEPRINA